MLNNTKKIKEIYEEIQRKIYYIVPGRWDELYLYSSIIDRLGNIETGEMYFYFLPKSIIKRKYINVYEVPNKYNIEEDEYLKLVKLLYDEIKKLRIEFKNSNQELWSNLTISIKGTKFKVEYNYENLLGSQDLYYQHHIYWRYKYLNIEPHGKKEKKAFEDYLSRNIINNKKNELYYTGIYLKKRKNIITYDTLDFKNNQRVELLATKQETKKVRNQILS